MGLLCCFSKSRSSPTTPSAHPEPGVAAVLLGSLPAPRGTDGLTDAPDAPSLTPFSDTVTQDPQPGPINETETNEFPDSALGNAIAEFRKNYLKFTKKNSPYISNVNEDVEKAMKQAASGRDIKHASKIFEEHIVAVVEARQSKQDVTEAKWTGKVGGFLKEIYPVALMSLKLASSVGEVANIAPLKWAAEGLEITLKTLKEDSDRGKDFLRRLKGIEYQAARVGRNPHIGLNSDNARDFMAEKSEDLIVAIVNFFNSALVTFNSQFFAEFIKKLVADGSKEYDDKAQSLDQAIKEYDQAIFDLTATIVARLEYKETNKETNEFLRWLSPSFWLVEAQLYNVQTHRGNDTLQWAYTMREFQNWRNSSIDDTQSKERILWICGSLGVGKSIMAGYFIDLLIHAYPDAIVAYFFCKKGQDGLTRGCDVIRTLAYQLAKLDKSVYDALDELKRSDAFQIDEKLGVAFLFKKLISEPLSLNNQTKEVYIIVDGIDEADFTVKDLIRKKPEMEILINCLVKLPSVRLLFTNRPIEALYRVQSLVKKVIEKNDNERDINAYVKQIIDASETLKEGFEREKIDPYEYFSAKANSIFLWVVIVLERLEKAETEEDFKKSLAGFSESCGDMELLYTAVLSTFTKRHRIWIAQILTWLIVGAEAFTVEQVKAAVENSETDKLLNFKRFLDVQCGAILRLVPAGGRKRKFTVQLIHETFRSYLLDLDLTCNGSFRIDEENAHEEVTRVCLRTLCSGRDSELTEYAALHWAHHISKVNVS